MSVKPKKNIFEGTHPNETGHRFSNCCQRFIVLCTSSEFVPSFIVWVLFWVRVHHKRGTKHCGCGDERLEWFPLSREPLTSALSQIKWWSCSWEKLASLRWEHLAFNSITPPRTDQPPLVLSQLGTWIIHHENISQDREQRELSCKVERSVVWSMVHNLPLTIDINHWFIWLMMWMNNK